MRKRLLIGLLLIACATGGVAVSSASFFSSSMNPTNAFGAKADWVPPTSSASSPSTTTNTTFNVTYTSGDAGGGVAEVELWVKRPGDSSYSMSATDTTPASPSFSYTAGAGAGSYSFYTRARDNAGNYETAPGAADTTTSLTAADTTKPESSATSPATAIATTFTVGLSASDTGGLAGVELWVKRPGDVSYSLVQTYATSATSFSTNHTYTAAAGQGSYSFYTRAKDAAANYEDAPVSPDSTTVYDATKPSSAATSPASSKDSPFTVSYSASDGASGSGIDKVELYVRRPSDGSSAYSVVATDTDPSTPSFSYTPNDGQGSYRFYTRAYDKAGNAELAPGSPPDDTTIYDTTKPVSDATNGVATNTNSSPFTVNYDSSDGSGGSLVLEVELWVKRPGDSSFSLAQTDTTPSSSSFSYVPDAGNGSYGFYTRARDNAGNYEDAPAAADDSTTYTRRPRAVAVSAVNGGATPGKLENGDQLILTFDEAIDQSTIKSGWTNPATAQTVTVAGNSQTGANEAKDDLTVSGVNVGTVELDGDYLSADANFTSSSMSINAARTVLTITLSNVSNARPTAVGAKNMDYSPDTGIKSATGQSIENIDAIETDSDVDF